METQEALTVLSALAHESRLRVFRLLVQAGEGGRAAGEIADELDIPPPTLSFHLGHLSRSGLVQSQRDGRSVRYAIRSNSVRDLLGFITHDCCEGRPELCLPEQADSGACRESEC